MQRQKNVMADDGNEATWNEESRLSALYRYRILETPEETEFDDIVTLAAQLLDAPIAVISLIDRHRQWFKAETGLGVRELPLDNSVCKFALLQSDGMVIPDLTQDERFCRDPLVNIGKGLRFYAGERLETADGLPLGTLCVLDAVPRPTGLTEQQRFALRALARQVMAQLNLRVALHEQAVLLEQQKATQLALEVREKRTLDAIHQAASEKSKLDALLEAAPVAIGYINADGKPIKLNAGNRAMWADHPLLPDVNDYGNWKGWWADGASRHGQRLLPNEWAAARALAGETVLGDVVDIEASGMPGVKRRIVLSAAPVRDDNERIIGAMLVQMDISSQETAEATLRQSEAKFRVITNAISQMVWATQPGEETDYFNDRTLEFTGQPKEALHGPGWANFIHPDDLEGAYAAWQHALATEEPLESEYRLRHHSGQYRWVLGRALPLRKEDGTTYWMGTFTDIDEQKKVAEQLRLANERKDEFLAMLAHELRNPLAPIANAVQVLRIRARDEAQVQNLISIIERQVNHMTELVNDLLDVSRITQGLVELHMAPVDMKAVVEEAVEQARPLLEAKGHAFHATFSTKHPTVLGNRTRLIQTISNLLTNAAKYTPEGGEIHLEFIVSADKVAISIQDNGAGIEASLLPNVFDLFTQARRTPDRVQGGLGLGLTLVKRIAELHNGSVLAESKGLHQGSTFTLVLPLAVDECEPHKVARSDVSAPSACNARRILIVDDNVDAAESLAMLFEGQGHTAIVEANGLKGLEAALSHLPDIVILDIGLPDIDGYALAKRLRAEDGTRNAVLLALTGYGQEQDKELARAAGFDHHLVKPVNFLELEKLIKPAAG